ncbi:MAG: 50S ribosomal protein L3 [Synechococcales cyanobacterium RM1_1_8]|nr:50S ribosomal protein L3 [Synechococcales cyanobacterium RM1_1_8]
MSVGILGTKIGMTQIFDEAGKAIPVTVVQAGPCKVTQVKTKATDGYEAVQIGFGEIREKLLTKPKKGHLAKSGAGNLRHLKEYRVDNASTYEAGQDLGVAIFEAGQLVDVTGKTTGRGFAGYQKRHNFKRGLMTHGSKSHREPGSTGPGTTPGRVYPGKKMAGRLGNETRTTRKLTIVRVDPDRNLLLIKGAIPGKPGGLLSIASATIVGRQ